jgi:hypothetical protein
MKPKTKAAKTRAKNARFRAAKAKARSAAALCREHFTRELSKPHVAAYMRERVLKQLAIAAARAGAVKGELLDSDNEMVRDRASTFVLGLADIAPASTPALSVNLEMRAGYSHGLSRSRRGGPATSSHPGNRDRSGRPH